MAIYLAGVTHDVKQNTLEATWLEETATELKRHKVQNYSAEQKQDFLDALNTVGEPVDGTKYVTMAGW